MRPADGTLVWAVDGAAPNTSASPVGTVLDGVPQILAHGYKVRDGGQQSELYRVRLTDGKILWSFIYAYTGDELVAVHAADGTFQWRERNNYGRLTLARDRLYVLAYNTVFCALSTPRPRATKNAPASK